MPQQIFVNDEELAVVMAMREHKAVTPHQQAYDLLRHSAMFVNWSIKSGLIMNHDHFKMFCAEADVSPEYGRMARVIGEALKAVQDG